ncbi:transcription factor bHLH140 isoform X2, partial [Fagus crenata]
ARRHLLVVPRSEGLDCLADVRKEHLQSLRTMHDVGLKWAEKFLQEDASLIFRLGYHSAPSMRLQHIHVISQDFDSKHLKKKKHWNSFNTAFFLNSVDVIEDHAAGTTLNNVSVDDQSKKRHNREAMAFEVHLHSVWALQVATLCFRGYRISLKFLSNSPDYGQ